MKWLPNKVNRWRIETGANTILDHDHQLAFICVPKAASSAIKQAIGEWFGWDVPPEEWKEAWGREQWVQPVHQLAWDYIQTEDVPAGYLSLCIVRNPLERVISAFHNPGPQIVGQTEWDEYLERVSIYPDEDINIHLKSNCWFERGRADVLGDTSTISETWLDWQVTVHERTGKLFPDLTQRNVSNATGHFTAEQEAMLRERYAIDYETYGHFWDEARANQPTP